MSAIRGCTRTTRWRGWRRIGRRVRAIELAPEYVDVCILRWRQLFPDKPPLLADGGRTFEDVKAERGKRAA